MNIAIWKWIINIMSTLNFWTNKFKRLNFNIRIYLRNFNYSILVYCNIISTFIIKIRKSLTVPFIIVTHWCPINTYFIIFFWKENAIMQVFRFIYPFFGCFSINILLNIPNTFIIKNTRTIILQRN